MVLVNIVTSLLQILHLKKNLAAYGPLGEVITQTFHNYALWAHGDYNLLFFASPFIDLISLQIVP